MRKSVLVWLTVVQLLLVLIPDVPLVTAGNSEGWWNLDWNYRRRLDITERSGYSLTSFPVDVVFEHGGNAQSDGDDIRIIVDGSARLCGQVLFFYALPSH